MPKLQIKPVYHPAIFMEPDHYQLLFPKPKPWLTNYNDQQTFFGLIALQDEMPIGGIFGIHDHLKQHFQIHSWMVQANHRGKGLGQRLLRTLETHLAKKNLQQIDLAYREEWPSYPLLQHILNKQGWTAPKAASILYQLNPLTTLPNWVNTLKLPTQLEVVPWQTLMPAEQEQLLTQNRSDPSTTPPETATLATAISFGLRRQQQLIGGLVSHQLRQDLLQYSTFWVTPRWQAKGYGYYLLQAALRAQQQNSIPHALFQIGYNHPGLMASVDKHLSTLIQYKSTLKLSTKSWIYVNRKAQAARRPGIAYHPSYSERKLAQTKELNA